MLLDDLRELTNYHAKNCELYNNYINSFYPDSKDINSIEDIPFLPVRAFKEFDIKSIPSDEIYKVMTSSGTSGNFSKIYLDKTTAKLQTNKLVEIMSNTFVNSRFPMIVIDSMSSVRERAKFSARTAAINGFSIFGRKRIFALDDDNNLDIEGVKAFIQENQGQTFFIFGFTFMIWEHLIKKLKDTKEEIDLSDSFVLHGGGWKKLENEKVSNETFKDSISETIGCRNIRNYYGMVEQTGTIFMECPNGHLHASDGSDVLVRDFETLEPLPHGKEGVIQIFSSIQKSYPGHSILTEDVGTTYAGKDCPCGNTNNIVSIAGRLKSAEIRGCSDAYAQ